MGHGPDLQGFEVVVAAAERAEVVGAGVSAGAVWFPGWFVVEVGSAGLPVAAWEDAGVVTCDEVLAKFRWCCSDGRAVVEQVAFDRVGDQASPGGGVL